MVTVVASRSFPAAWWPFLFICIRCLFTFTEETTEESFVFQLALYWPEHLSLLLLFLNSTRKGTGEDVKIVWTHWTKEVKCEERPGGKLHVKKGKCGLAIKWREKWTIGYQAQLRIRTFPWAFHGNGIWKAIVSAILIHSNSLFYLLILKQRFPRIWCARFWIKPQA